MANIHSIETLGLLDGPGIRTVFFFKGCLLKCLYCHNPDTQLTTGGTSYTVESLVNIAKKYKNYYKSSGGGVTLSGGEPLMQGAFLLELIKALKAESIHVTLDTSGYGDKRYFDEILSMVDLVLLDIKHVESFSHKKLVGHSMNGLHQFMGHLAKSKTDTWIRHVMVPTMTDSETIMNDLYNLCKKIEHCIVKYEILPYHKLGVDKYSQLGQAYQLAHLPEMDKDVVKIFEDMLNEKLDSERSLMRDFKKII